MTATKVKHFQEWLGWFKTERLKPKNYFTKIKTEKK